MNMRNCGYSAKWWNGGGGDCCSMVDGNGSHHGLVPSSSEEIAWMAHADIKNIASDDQATLTPNGHSKLRKYHAVLWNLCLRNRDWCSTVDGGFWWSLKRHVADIKSIVGNDQVTLTITKFLKFMSLRARKAIRNSFSCCWMPPYWCYCAMFFSY